MPNTETTWTNMEATMRPPNLPWQSSTWGSTTKPPNLPWQTSTWGSMLSIVSDNDVSDNDSSHSSDSEDEDEDDSFARNTNAGHPSDNEDNSNSFENSRSVLQASPHIPQPSLSYGRSQDWMIDESLGPHVEVDFNFATIFNKKREEGSEEEKDAEMAENDVDASTASRIAAASTATATGESTYQAIRDSDYHFAAAVAAATTDGDMSNGDAEAGSERAIMSVASDVVTNAGARTDAGISKPQLPLTQVVAVNSGITHEIYHTVPPLPLHLQQRVHELNSNGQGRRKPPPAVKNYLVLSDDMVIFGKGGMTNSHPGNIRFRRDAQIAKFEILSDGQKDLMISTFLHIIRTHGGRQVPEVRLVGLSPEEKTSLLIHLYNIIHGLQGQTNARSEAVRIRKAMYTGLPVKTKQAMAQRLVANHIFVEEDAIKRTQKSPQDPTFAWIKNHAIIPNRIQLGDSFGLEYPTGVFRTAMYLNDTNTHEYISFGYYVAPEHNAREKAMQALRERWEPVQEVV